MLFYQILVYTIRKRIKNSHIRMKNEELQILIDHILSQIFKVISSIS